MRLTDILTPRRIKVPLTSDTKAGVIEELVDLLAADGTLNDRDRMLQAVMEREKTRTTGIGEGLAIPHGKSSAAADLAMALGEAPDGVDFESVDGKPVTIVFLLVSPMDKTGPHIQALARLSKAMTDVELKESLEKADSPQKAYELLTSWDDQNANG